MNHLIRKNRLKLFYLLQTGLVALVCFFAAEVFLRMIPIPGVQFSRGKYNDLVGRGYDPNSLVTYRNARREYVERTVNRWGYLDVKHERGKEDGIFRIGFLGDSYTEAKQVNVDSTFFRIIGQELSPSNVECLAFGHSGFGIVHSYLISTKEMKFFDLDMVVYVFVENDLGDQIREIKGDPNFPYVYFKNGKLFIDNSFRERNEFRKRWPYRFFRFFQARSLLIQTVRKRIQLLIDVGVKSEVTEEDRSMSTRSQADVPNQNDLPSSWPDSLRNHALELASAMIMKWKNEVKSQAKEFVIMYVPRKSEWQKKSDDQDSWKSWLEDFCLKENIILIDPTESFWEARSKNKEIYYDHFTKSGHKAFAGAFVKWYNNYYH